MFLSHFFLAVYWILYVVLHSLLADLRVKKWAQQKLGKNVRYYRLFYTLFAALSLAALILYQLRLDSPMLLRRTTFITIGGSVLAGAGLVLMAVCIKKYFLSLSGLKSLYEERPATELMIAGIHRFMRHPLYTGTFLAIWGFWLLFPTLSLLIADTIITLYTLLAIRWEEEKLVVEFGESYRRYQQTVPKLFPRFIGRKLLVDRP